MVRKLFILRHGEAESGSKWSDFERPLTNQGRATIESQGKRLQQNEINFDLLLSSDAKRTQQTAKTFLQTGKWKPEIIYYNTLYNAELGQVLKVLTALDTKYQEVLLVGHNPALSELAAYLLGVNFISMTPGQLIGCEMEIEKWNELSGNTASVIEL